MRRALLAAAIAVPLVALAVSATPGQLLETTNFNAKAVPGTSYINLAQCSGTTTTNPLNVEFNIPGASGGTYNLYASTAKPATATGGSVTLCAETSSPNAVPPVYAGGVGSSITADSPIKDVAMSGSDVMKVIAPTSPTCDASKENTQIWICAHWTDTNSTKDVASATGMFTLQFAKPDPPSGVSATPGSGRLYVSWTPATGGAILADHFVAVATPSGGASVSSGSTTASSVTVNGLQNGTDYTVVVYAYSIGGNQSVPSGSVVATPVPGADFWQVYKSRGGEEQGGCSSGGAGALGLLGAAALLAIRRRRP